MKQYFKKTALALAIAGGSAGNTLAQTSANPTAVNITVTQTQVYNGTSWVTVMSNSAGVKVDLLGNIGTAFGEAAVDEGTYSKVKFTVKNELDYSAAAITGTDNCAAQTATPFLIDSVKTATDPVDLVFATDGGVGWRANGTEAFPYLMSQPVIVAANQTTDVKLAFKTANMVECSGTSASITPPSFDVISTLVPVVATSGGFTGGDYWIVGMSKHSNDHLWDGATEITPQMVSIGTPAVTMPLYDVLLHSTNTTETIGTTTYGPYTDPFNSNTATITVGEYFRTQLRRNATSELRWGMKVRFTPSAAGSNTGTLSIVRNPGTHRHQLDESYGASGTGATAAPTTDAATPVALGTYEIDANNRFTMITSDGELVKGAFDPGYEVLTAANVSQPNGSTELTVGIKVQTTGTSGPVLNSPTNTSTSYTWLSYDFEFDRYTAAGATAMGGAPWAATQSSMAWYDSNIGIMKMTDVAGALTMDETGYRSAARLDRPLSMDECDWTAVSPTCDSNPFWGSSESSNNYSSQSLTTAAITPVGSDIGAGLLSGMGSNPPWVAVAQNAGVVAVASGTDDISTNHSTTNSERHHMGYAMIMEQASLNTHTVANVAGTYMINFMWDEFTNGVIKNGGGYGELTLNGSGGLAATVHTKNSDGAITTESVNANYEVKPICFGFTIEGKEVSAALDSGSTSYPYVVPSTGTSYADANALRTYAQTNADALRLSPTDTTCTGGNKVDLILGYDPALGTVFASGNPKIAMMVNKTGNVLTFTDPQSIGGGNHRQLGVGVKLR